MRVSGRVRAREKHPPGGSSGGMGAREGEVARRWYGNLLYGVHPRGRDDGDRGEEDGKAHVLTKNLHLLTAIMYTYT
jgi:hypothetical protein